MSRYYTIWLNTVTEEIRRYGPHRSRERRDQEMAELAVKREPNVWIFAQDTDGRGDVRVEKVCHAPSASRETEQCL